LSGWIYGTVLPIAEIHTTSLSRIEFMFSHLAALSLIAGFLAGLVNARFRHRVAQYVWTIPTGILLYNLATFTPQVLTQDRLAAAVHYYFGGGFLVPEYHSWKEFWSMMRGNPDMARGFEQAQVTGPLYSAVAYSLAAWICLHTSLDKKFVRKFEEWEYAR